METVLDSILPLAFCYMHAWFVFFFLSLFIFSFCQNRTNHIGSHIRTSQNFQYRFCSFLSSFWHKYLAEISAICNFERIFCVNNLLRMQIVIFLTRNYSFKELLINFIACKNVMGLTFKWPPFFCLKGTKRGYYMHWTLAEQTLGWCGFY